MAPKPYRAIKPMFQTGRWRIFPGDMVYVNHGPYKDQTGKVLQVLKDPRVPQVLVQGINLRKMKIPTGEKDDEYMVVTIEAPIHYSQVSLLEPMTSREAATEGDKSKDASTPFLEASKRWVRAKFRYLADGTRVRIGTGPNATGAIIPIPPQVEDKTNRLGIGGKKDAKVEEVVRITYQDDGRSGFDKWLGSVQQQGAEKIGAQNTLTQGDDSSVMSKIDSKNNEDGDQGKGDGGGGGRPLDDSRAADQSRSRQPSSHRAFSTASSVSVLGRHHCTSKQQYHLSAWPALLCTQRQMHDTATASGNLHAHLVTHLLPSQSSSLHVAHSFASYGLSMRMNRTT